MIIRTHFPFGIAITCVLFLIHFFSSAQRYINTEWVSLTGTSINLDWSNSVLTEDDYLYTVGNTLNSGSSSDILLTKYWGGSGIVWQKTYNDSMNLEDYGMFVALDETDNVYVLGASGNLASHTLDMVLIKFDPDGVLQWEKGYGSAYGYDDVPFGMYIHGNSIYVGVNEGVSSTDIDIRLFEFDLDGDEQWTQTYDYNTLADVGVSLQYYPDSSEIVISGISADSTFSYSTIVLDYENNGTPINSYRNPTAVNIDEPTSMCVDTTGNVLVCGYHTLGTGNTQMVLASLSNTLSLNWIEYLNPNYSDDVWKDVKVYPDGQVVVTGYSKDDDDYVIRTASYSSGGTLLWNEDYHVYFEEKIGSAQGFRLAIDDEGIINVGGMAVQYAEIGEENDTNYILLQYDYEGELLSSTITEIDGSQHLATMQVNQGGIYFCGTTYDLGGGSYSNVRFETYVRDGEVTGDSTNPYMAHELIVRVDPGDLNMGFVNNRAKKFGRANEVLNSGLIAKMESEFDESHGFDGSTLIKIFPELTTSNTYSITRHGDTIPMDTFWNYFLLELPQTVSVELARTELDSIHFRDSTSSGIFFTCYNYVGANAYVTCDPNSDPNFCSGGVYTNQLSLLESAGAFKSGINAIGAWKIWEGTNNLKIAVLDDGISSFHQDFVIGGLTSATKIVGGHDYVNRGSIYNYFPAPFSHGTSVAGIFGAIRNNGLNVAGIAGGNANNNNRGCKILAFKVLLDDVEKEYNKRDNSQRTKIFDQGMHVEYNAIISAATDDPNNPSFGFGANVLNISFGTPSQDIGHRHLFNTAKHWAAKNQAVFAAARGNHDNTYPVIPATGGPDYMSLSVGACHTNGLRLGGVSSYGLDMDLLAPGFVSNVMTLHGPNNGVTAFDGTSAATPHVAGTAGLMVDYVKDLVSNSYAPNELSPEDIENIIERTAVNYLNPGTYDLQNGWGRLDASEAMKHIKKSDYIVKHWLQSVTTSSLTPVCSNCAVTIYSTNNFPADIYTCDIYEISITISIPSIAGYTDIATWPLNSSPSTVLWGPPVSSKLEPFTNVLFSGYSPGSSVTAKGYFYKVLKNSQNTTINRWLPSDLKSAGTTKIIYTVYYENDYLGMDLRKPSTFEYEIFPNPASNKQFVHIQTEKNRDLSIELIDIQGRLVKNVYTGFINNDVFIENDISDLKSGIYIYKFNCGGEIHFTKIVRN